jgi:hypothetical protein
MRVLNQPLFRDGHESTTEELADRVQHFETVKRRAAAVTGF